MQGHRIFIAINLPDNTKQKLTTYQKKIRGLFISSVKGTPNNEPVRWTRKDNLHITLNFIGYVNNDGILEIFEIVKKVASKHSPFLVNLNKICYGPINKKLPKMVWAIGKKSEKFASLRDDLEKSLSDFPEVRQDLSTNGKQRKFSPHITLGRIRQWEWRRIEPEERPAVDENIDLSFSVGSIEIMESILKRKGPEYTALKGFSLSG